jgi:hypothetical protein
VDVRPGDPLPVGGQPDVEALPRSAILELLCLRKVVETSDNVSPSGDANV